MVPLDFLVNLSNYNPDGIQFHIEIFLFWALDCANISRTFLLEWHHPESINKLDITKVESIKLEKSVVVRHETNPKNIEK